MLGFHLQENICFVQRVVLGILSTQSSDSCGHLIHCCDAPKQIKISNIMIQDCLFSPQLANLTLLL